MNDQHELHQERREVEIFAKTLDVIRSCKRGHHVKATEAYLLLAFKELPRVYSAVLAKRFLIKKYNLD